MAALPLARRAAVPRPTWDGVEGTWEIPDRGGKNPHGYGCLTSTTKYVAARTTAVAGVPQASRHSMRVSRHGCRSRWNTTAIPVCDGGVWVVWPDSACVPGNSKSKISTMQSLGRRLIACCSGAVSAIPHLSRRQGHPPSAIHVVSSRSAWMRTVQRWPGLLF